MDPYCYIFVNTKLGMNKGKIASQVGHGIHHLCKNLEDQPKYTKECWEQWETTGSAMIVLKSDEAEMLRIHDEYPSCKIIDQEEHKLLLDLLQF